LECDERNPKSNENDIIIWEEEVQQQQQQPIHLYGSGEGTTFLRGQFLEVQAKSKYENGVFEPHKGCQTRASFAKERHRSKMQDGRYKFHALELVWFVYWGFAISTFIAGQRPGILGFCGAIPRFPNARGISVWEKKTRQSGPQRLTVLMDCETLCLRVFSLCWCLLYS
jgi:hypothetical protein